MEARNKKIEDWFSLIKQGQVVLPRFQRHEAWRQAQVVGLLENVLRDPPLPIGALLTLEVGNEELFHSRPIVGAPKPQSKPSLHLLDGQQRMTALWRSLTGDYLRDGMGVFISLKPGEPDEEADAAEIENVDAPRVEAVKRWERKGVLQPIWANDPVATMQQGFSSRHHPVPRCPRRGGQRRMGGGAGERWPAQQGADEAHRGIAAACRQI